MDRVHARDLVNETPKASAPCPLNASLEEKRLAVQLIRAKKAGVLSSQQEEVLRILAQDHAEAMAGSGVH